MPLDPLWIAIYIALALGALALGAACYIGMHARDTRDGLEQLVARLRSSGLTISGGNGRNGQSTGQHAEPERSTEVTTTIDADRVAMRSPIGSEDPQRLIAPPPQVLTADGAIATGDWLQHYALPLPGGVAVTWPLVVVEFYRRLGLDDEVASYFYLADMTKIKQHFALVITKVTRQGITLGDRETLRVAHRNVRNRRGEPITGAVYDKIIVTLAEVLSDYGVPPQAIGDLARMLNDADLRSVLVVEPARTI